MYAQRVHFFFLFFLPAAFFSSAAVAFSDALLAFTSAFTIFCSSMRKARMILEKRGKESVSNQVLRDLIGNASLLDARRLHHHYGLHARSAGS